MTTQKQANGPKPQVVGVIASLADLRFAARMQQPPDLFELRLDFLYPVLIQAERQISRLKSPKIFTARDPREGGANKLSLAERRELLSRFLPLAKYIDTELRSERAFKPLLAEARKRNVGVILSFHDFSSTPLPRSLRARAELAKRLGADVFKIATRTDKPSELARLIDFMTNNKIDLPLSAMGIGKLGAVSRLLLATCGSILNYGSLSQSVIEGQLPIDALRSAIRPPSF